MATKTKNRTLTDLLRYEVNPDFTRDAVTLRNGTASPVTLTDPVGYPLKYVSGKYLLAVAGDEGTVDALLLATEDFEAVGATTDFAGKQVALVRGPAIISKAGLPTVDVANAAFNLTTLIATLAALGIQVHTEPVKQQEQET